MDDTCRKEIRTLIDRSKNAFVSSVDADGYPNTKAMFALERDAWSVYYFSTNLSSMRATQFAQNPKACLYFCDEQQYQGLMLVGEMQVCCDRINRARLWRDGFEVYYPKGIDDEDYCVLRFAAHRAKYYHGLSTITFPVEDLCDDD